MRLGLLLGNGRHAGVDVTELPGQTRPQSNPKLKLPHLNNLQQGHDSSAASFSSLTSFETQTHPSNNTSPVSTLTGTSSEAEAVAALRSPLKLKGKVKGVKSKSSSRDCDSAGSLASISTSASNSMSMSVSVSGLSNGSASPLTTRRHSVTTSQPGQVDELGQTLFKNRKTCVRRSARAGTVKGSFDSKSKIEKKYIFLSNFYLFSCLLLNFYFLQCDFFTQRN